MLEKSQIQLVTLDYNLEIKMTEKKDLLPEEKREIEMKKESTFPVKRYRPATDIIETENELMVYMDVPGVARENVNVKLEKNVLVVEGLIQPEGYENMKPLYTEYNIGNFFRQFELSNEIDQEKIEAKIDEGVLTLVLPKAPEHQPKSIQVN